MRSAGDQLTHYRLAGQICEKPHEVWGAVDTRNERLVALKILPHLSNPLLRDRLRGQADAIAEAAHPSIVVVDAIGVEDGVHFVCTEAIEGTSLADLVQRGGFDPARLLRHAVTLADAVRTAHDAGVTHRELAPDRVFVTQADILRIHDFGLSATDEGGEDPNRDPEDTPTLTLTRDGSRRDLAYLAPEQIKNLPLDYRTDIYSVGAILYFMATGVNPFHGESPADLFVAVLRDLPRPVKQLKHDVADGLAAIIERCLRKERDQRYPGAGELHAELAKLI